jgi:hypothetical protein
MRAAWARAWIAHPQLAWSAALFTPLTPPALQALMLFRVLIGQQAQLNQEQDFEGRRAESHRNLWSGLSNEVRSLAHHPPFSHSTHHFRIIPHIRRYHPTVSPGTSSAIDFVLVSIWFNPFQFALFSGEPTYQSESSRV